MEAGALGQIIIDPCIFETVQRVFARTNFDDRYLSHAQYTTGLGLSNEQYRSPGNDQKANANGFGSLGKMHNYLLSNVSVLKRHPPGHRKEEAAPWIVRPQKRIVAYTFRVGWP